MYLTELFIPIILLFVFIYIYISGGLSINKDTKDALYMMYA